MKRIGAGIVFAGALALWGAAASAACPTSSPQTIEAYVYGCPTISGPFASSLIIPAVPNSTTAPTSSLEGIPANLLATLSDTQTLINKTLNCSNNTCTNIPTTALTGILSSSQFNSGLTSAVLDLIGSTRGMVLFRGASGWSVLSPGTSGYFLQTSGPGADPSWQPSGGGSGITQLTGDVTAGPGTGSQVATIGNNIVTNGKLFTMPLNTIKANPTGGTANATDMSVPSCPDTGGNHLNWVSNTGITCGTSGSGGGAAVSSSGTFSGSVGVYTTTGTTPAFAANSSNYRFCGFWPSGLQAPTGTATLAVGTASAMPLRVRSANNGIIPFTGKEIVPGTNGNTFCVQADSTPSTWVLDTQAPGSSTSDPSSPYSVTQGDWASQGQFIQDTAGTTYNLPNLASTSLSNQAGVTIQTIGVTATLCATGSDVINTGLLTGASGAGGCITLPADGLYPVSTSGTAGATAWKVPLGQLQYFFLTWAEGLNLSTNARYISRFASPKVIYGIKCNVQAASGSAGVVHVFSTASTVAPGSGTQLDTTGCNPNIASNTEQDMGVASGGVGTTTPGYTIWMTDTSTGVNGSGGLTITYR